MYKLKRKIISLKNLIFVDITINFLKNEFKTFNDKFV
jgi:hypothetical protein